MAIIGLDKDPRVAIRDWNAVVVFYTDWCGDCVRSLGYELKLSEELEGKVKFFRMDAERYERIADGCGVERYPTYVFFRDGKPAEGVLVEPASEREARDWIGEKLKGN